MTLNFPLYRQYMEVLLCDIGFQPRWSEPVAQIIVVTILLLCSFLMGYLFRKLVAPLIQKVVSHTQTKWDDYLVNTPVLQAISHLIPCLIIYHLLPRCFDSNDATSFVVISRLTQAYITLCVTAGLGAMATVLMLVFKDSILGLVAGIQLSLNKMLRVGDWVTIDKLNINGTVEEISLTTVKVRNFDNTISTIPPYTLVSDSFQNWNGMVNQGARRVKRTIHVNMLSIRFADGALIESLRKEGLLPVLPEHEPTIGRTTNLALFRSYVNHRLQHLPEVESSQWAFIRQLNPTPDGLPLELWFYLKNTAFVSFEEEAATIIEHFITVLPAFGLEIFQSPTGTDLRSFRSR